MERKVINQLFIGLILLSTAACTWEQIEPRVDCSTSQLSVELLQSNDAGCNIANGSFTVSASGGTAPYSYTSGLGTNADGVYENVNAGTYAVTATDINGCSAELSVAIQNLEGLNLDDVVVSNAGCETNGGTIQISASGGQEPFTYSINGGAEQSDNSFSDLAHGSYDVGVIDHLGCEITQSVEVLTGVSYENSVQSIIENSCAISGCHSGNVSPDLRTFENIQASAGAIKTRTANRSMPQGSSLSQEQIDMISCWVDDGALGN